MDRVELEEYYVEKGFSVSQIAEVLQCSSHKVYYWMQKYNITRRGRSEAVYVRKNGMTDPFEIREMGELSAQDKILYGLGVGIYWGEGNKRNKNAVRVGNTDPQLIYTFVQFLIKVCGVPAGKIRYGIQIFTDTNESEVLLYWQRHLDIPREQIMPTVSRIITGKAGSYKYKNSYGVMTVYVFNTKLRNWLVKQLEMVYNMRVMPR